MVIDKPEDVEDPVPLDPSPKSQEKDVILPSGSLEAEALNETSSGPSPEVGDAVKDATGADPPTVMVCVAEAERPSLSVTVNSTVYVSDAE